jgi:hypothetical protein
VSWLTRALAGQTINHVLTNGHMLRIVCEGGHEVDIGWRDPNGDPVDGTPVVLFAGKRVHVKGGLILHRSELGL